MRNALRSTCAAALAAALALPAAGGSAEAGPGAGAPAPASASTAPEGTALLLEVVGMWLASNFDLPASSELPRLVFASPETLATLRYGADAAYDAGEVVSVYKDDEDTIYLGEGWDGGTPAGLSVVVHEMVHYLQDVGELRFACPGEREALAYRAQEAWLGMFGTSLAEGFEIDPMTLMLRTTCAY